MDLVETVTHVAFTFGAWVFGGFVRDVCVCKSSVFTDVDIMFPKSANLDHYVQVLDAFYGNDFKVRTDDSYPEGMYMSHMIVRRIYVQVKDIFLDLCLYNGTLEDWKSERTADFSCNLFYSSAEVDLGIRYVPGFLKHTSSPLDELMRMAQDKIFHLVWEGEFKLEKLNRLAIRLECLKNKGWRPHFPFFSNRIIEYVESCGNEVDKWPMLKNHIVL